MLNVKNYIMVLLLLICLLALGFVLWCVAIYFSSTI